MLRLAGLPLQKGGKKQPTLPWQRIPYFFNELSRMDGISARALSFLILTALRSSEVRLARWSWLSFEPVPTLTIPGEFMKKRESDPVVSHRVPLAPEVLCVLVKAHYLTTYQQISVADLPNVARQMRDELFFPSPLKNVALSDMSLSAVMRRMNAGSPDEATPLWCDPDGRKAVPHGFRGSFRTWVDDVVPHEDVAAEKALAHSIGNAVSGRYRHSDLFDRRIKLMSDWATHCASVAKRTSAI
jgi:integrase